MNQRIEHCLYQAGLTASGCWDELGTYEQEAIEKFAELIVFECVKAVMDGTKESDHYAQRIEQHFDNGTGGVLHFGVEE